MVSIACKRRTQFLAHKKVNIISFIFALNHPKMKILRKKLGHVPINRSHKMDNHFLPPEVTSCEINTQILRKYAEKLQFLAILHKKNLGKKLIMCP